MRLTKHTNYAIKMLIECARAEPGTALRIADVVERVGLTVQHGLKIGHALMKGGFVVNQRGRIGGIRLARPPEEIRVGDVVRALETTNLDGSDETPVPRAFDAAFVAFLSVLDGHTIADFAREANAAPATRSASKPKRAMAGKENASPPRRTSTAKRSTSRPAAS